ncbi:hypothetical protein ACTPOK_01965 [Streptomyces inhibens]|uniref:hypothetical protein n=1 Tax=Streptomyces inhibens TaxID=2293571 RepID=UPI00402A9E15
MAGFDVAALSFLLSAKRSADRADSWRPDGIITLLSSLVALVVAAFLYGVAAAVEIDQHRAAAMVLASGIAASVAVSGLFLGLLLLVSVAVPALTDDVAHGVAFVIPVFDTAYVSVSLSTTLALSALLQLIWNRPLMTRLAPRFSPLRRKIEIRCARLSLAVVFLSLGVFLFYMHKQGTADWSGATPVAASGAWTAFVILFMLAICALTESTPTSRRPAP